MTKKYNELLIKHADLVEKNNFNEDLMVSTADLIKRFTKEWRETHKALRIFKALGFIARLIIKLNEEENKLRVK
tara:strand:- start:530 stop:751 length:222 start_codon:yes stop_codon:yes gene_type:complete